MPCIIEECDVEVLVKLKNNTNWASGSQKWILFF